MLTLLMTRPQGAAERFVAGLPPDLRALLTPVYSPLVGIVPAASTVEFGDARGLIFTSSNGVRITAGLSDRRDLPCYCVGNATAVAAKHAGWQAICAGTTAEGLISTLHRIRPDGPLLHMRGTHSRGNVAARLTALGTFTNEQVIYEQPLLPLNSEAVDLVAGLDPVIVPLFSPRTARHFARLVNGQAPLHLAALSEAVAKPLKALKYINLSISPSPEASAMAQLVGQLANNVGRVEGTKPAQ